MEGRITVGFVVLALGALLLGAVAGPALALGDELHNETVAVDSDTATVYAELTNTSNESVRVIFEGLDENATPTEVKNTTAKAPANETVTVKYDDVNASKYDEYRVRVHSVNNSTVESVTVGTLQKVAGGGGGGDGVGGTGLGVGAIVVLALGALLVLRD